MLTVRPALPTDGAGIWEILRPVIAEGETYALPSQWARHDALAYWYDTTHAVFVAEQECVSVGTYYLRANQLGGGSHVANCGYATAASARGRESLAKCAFIPLKKPGAADSARCSSTSSSAPTAPRCRCGKA